MAEKFLSEEDFRVICGLLKTFFDKFPDPPPDYRQSDFGKLDMVINSPRQTFDGNDLYPTVFHKAACYLYFINKFHPFNNGNKRVSIVATYVYLRYNGFILYVENEEMYAFSIRIAQSHKNQDKDFNMIVEFLKNHSDPIRRIFWNRRKRK